MMHIEEKREKTTINRFLDPSLEDLDDPATLYELRSRLDHVGKLLVLWNARRLEDREALFKIMSVLREFQVRAWARRKEILGLWSDYRKRVKL